MPAVESLETQNVPVRTDRREALRRPCCSAGVTIKDGGDWPAGLCAAPICVNISIADVASKLIETIRPMNMAGPDAFARGVSPRSDTQLV